MNGKSYFLRVSEETPTRFWINNPTESEARLAISHGAIHCTTNPTHTAKMLASAEMRPSALEWISGALERADSTGEAAALAQRSAVGSLMEIFRPLYDASPGKAGYVSLQGDPLAEDDPDNIVREALEGRKLGPNCIAKIPVTDAGLKAIDSLIRQDVPVIATEIMSISQVIAACEIYRKAAAASGCSPAYFVTNIAGIFDQCLRAQYDAGGLGIAPEVLFQAGTVLGRTQYRLMREREYPGIMLGGGARGTHHFTEFVGGALHITINWKNTADILVERDEPVVNRIDTPAPDGVLEALLGVPDFEKAYRADGLDIAQFAEFAPVVLFRSMFIDGWKALLKEVDAVRKGEMKAR